MASGRDAEGMAWLADVCLVGAGPMQTAARLGKLDAVRCMVEELGFDVNAGSQAGCNCFGCRCSRWKNACYEVPSGQGGRSK
uniref:Uncharacterized protein n=1 Tax=Aegilops tauschii subsp. strangulata TaxID=200361 RepID=A0A453H183_AEGTS